MRRPAAHLGATFRAGFLLLLWCLVAVGCERQRPITDRPNIILVIGDDHGFPYFGFMGDDVVQTPELDRLAEGGALFTNVHSTASSCRPALNTLLTGLHPVQWSAEVESLRGAGHSFAPNMAIEHVETLPKMLARAGYVSFQAGKYWEGPYGLAGFTDGMASEILPDKVQSPSVSRLGRETLEPVYDFIDENADRPFFLWFAPMLPHLPLDPPPEHRAPYEGRGLSDEAVRYFGNCTWFDAVTRDLLAHVEARGLRERTLVLYVSDNGWEQPRDADSGSPLGGPRGKLSMFELGFRTPMIVSWPRQVPAGTRVSGRASLVDVVPTLADYAGVEPPERLPGRSLRPVLEGAEWTPPRVSIGSMDVVRWGPTRPRQPGARFGNHERAYYVNGKRWHFIWYPQRRMTELYDVPRDPGLARNVAGEHPQIVKRLRQQVRSWQRRLLRPWREGSAAAPKGPRD